MSVVFAHFDWDQAAEERFRLIADIDRRTDIPIVCEQLAHQDPAVVWLDPESGAATAVRIMA